mmetsp:Transcript_8395/g.15319  ORF Transcript_8395/g.15319 Transcript_8395/m.15319 type:complete len:289 (+) Transcript_8395:109-975(+)
MIQGIQFLSSRLSSRVQAEAVDRAEEDESTKHWEGNLKIDPSGLSNDHFLLINDVNGTIAGTAKKAVGVLARCHHLVREGILMATVRLRQQLWVSHVVICGDLFEVRAASKLPLNDVPNLCSWDTTSPLQQDVLINESQVDLAVLILHVNIAACRIPDSVLLQSSSGVLHQLLFVHRLPWHHKVLGVYLTANVVLLPLSLNFGFQCHLVLLGRELDVLLDFQDVEEVSIFTLRLSLSPHWCELPAWTANMYAGGHKCWHEEAHRQHSNCKLCKEESTIRGESHSCEEA